MRFRSTGCSLWPGRSGWATGRRRCTSVQRRFSASSPGPHGTADVPGALVAQVVRGGPVDRAGVVPGDVITGGDRRPRGLLLGRDRQDPAEQRPGDTIKLSWIDRVGTAPPRLVKLVGGSRRNSAAECPGESAATLRFVSFAVAFCDQGDNDDRCTLGSHRSVDRGADRLREEDRPAALTRTLEPRRNEVGLEAPSRSSAARPRPAA